jgi:hypothetical protein
MITEVCSFINPIAFSNKNYLTKDVVVKAAKIAIKILSIIFIGFLGLKVFKYAFSTHVFVPPPVRLPPVLQYNKGQPVVLYQSHPQIERFLKDFKNVNPDVPFEDIFTIVNLPSVDNSLPHFPVEIWIKILNDIDKKSWGRVAQVSHQMKDIVYQHIEKPWIEHFQEILKTYQVNANETQYPLIPYIFRAKLYLRLYELFPDATSDSKYGHGLIQFLIRLLGPFTFLCIPVVKISDTPKHSMEIGTVKERSFIRFSITNDKGEKFVQLIRENKGGLWVTSDDGIPFWYMELASKERNVCYWVNQFIREDDDPT